MLQESLLKNRNFLYFVSAQVVSQIGDWVQWVTVLIFIYETTHSGIALSSVFLSMTVTRIVMAPIAGVIIDRSNRKKVMIYTSFGQGVLVLLLFQLLHINALTLYTLLILVISISILSTIYEPTKSAVIPTIVEKDEILKANSLMEVFMNAVWVLGPLAGGGIISLVGFGAGFILNALTFFVSGSLIFFMKLEHEHESQKKEKNTSHHGKMIQDIRDGLHYLKKNPIILSLIMAEFIMMLGAGAVNSQTPSLSQEVYSMDAKIGYPILLSAIGIGWILGSLFLVKSAGSLKKIRTKYLFWGFSRVIGGITVIMVAHLTQFYFGCFVWFFHGIFNSFHDTMGTTIVQETCDEQYLGRVFSNTQLLMETASLVSISLGGLIHDIYGIVLVYDFAGSLEILSVPAALAVLYVLKFHLLGTDQ